MCYIKYVGIIFGDDTVKSIVALQTDKEELISEKFIHIEIMPESLEIDLVKLQERIYSFIKLQTAYNNLSIDPKSIKMLPVAFGLKKLRMKIMNFTYTTEDALLEFFSEMEKAIPDCISSIQIVI